METNDKPPASSAPTALTPRTPAAGALEQRRTPTLLAGAAPGQDAVRVWSPDAKVLHSKARGFVASMAFIYANYLLNWLGPHWLPAMLYSILLTLWVLGGIVCAFWLLRNLGSVSYQLFGLPYCVSTDAEGIAVAGRFRSHQRRWSEITSCVYLPLYGGILIYAEGKKPISIRLAGYSDNDRVALLDTIVEKAALPLYDGGRGLQEIYGKPVGRRISFLSRIPHKFVTFGGLLPISKGAIPSPRSSPLTARQSQSAIIGPEHDSASGPERSSDED